MADGPHQTISSLGVLVGMLVAVVPGAVWVGGIQGRVGQLEKEVEKLGAAKPIVISPDDPIRKACASLVGKDYIFTHDTEARMKALNCNKLIGGGSGIDTSVETGTKAAPTRRSSPVLVSEK